MLEGLPQPIILAHRGASARAPENTLAAFRLAFEQGADGIELDAKLSADGRVVVIHDDTVDRTTGSDGAVAGLTLADLQSLDPGRYFSTAFAGERIPSLEEVFQSVTGRGIINIELRNYTTPGDALVESVYGLVRHYGTEHQILFSSFLPRNLTKCARLLPRVPRGLLAAPGWKGAWARSFGFMFGNYAALHLNAVDAASQQVQRVHRLQRRIHVWTINQTAEIQRLASWGVDGIFTDDPQVARLALHGDR